MKNTAISVTLSLLFITFFITLGGAGCVGLGQGVGGNLARLGSGGQCFSDVLDVVARSCLVGAQKDHKGMSQVGVLERNRKKSQCFLEEERNKKLTLGLYYFEVSISSIEFYCPVFGILKAWKRNIATGSIDGVDVQVVFNLDIRFIHGLGGYQR